MPFATHLRMSDHAAAGQHRRAGHALRGQAFQPLRRGTRQQHLLRHRQTFVDVLLPQCRRLEARIVEPFRTIERAGQRGPFAVGLHRGADVVIGGLVDQVDEAGGLLLRQFVADERLAAHVGAPQERDDRVQHRETNVLALPGPLAREQCRGDRLGGDHAGQLVGHDGADQARAFLVGAALNARQARNSAWINGS